MTVKLFSGSSIGFGAVKVLTFAGDDAVRVTVDRYAAEPSSRV